MNGLELGRARLFAQGLTPETASADVAAAVRRAGAVQAQDIGAARLSVRARTVGLTSGDVVAAVRDDRTVVWTWAMRGTLHLVPAADAGWLTSLLGPVFAARNRRRRLQLGLDDDLCQRALKAIAEVLADGRELVRADLVAELRALGVAVDPVGQAPAHVVGFAAMQGLVCRVDNGGAEPTYRLVGSDGAAERGPDEALAELARRHIAAYGPVTPADFACWSGLPMGSARHAWALIENGLVEVDTGDGPAWTLSEPYGTGTPFVVRLVGAFDAVLLGYRTRRWVLSDSFAKRIHPGAGIIHPAVLADGGVVARWGVRRERRDVTVSVQPFEPGWPSAGQMAELAGEVADVGRFLAMSTRLHVD